MPARELTETMKADPNKIRIGDTCTIIKDREGAYFCPVCVVKIIDIRRWVLICPNNHAFSHEKKDKWVCTQLVKPTTSTYEFINECWIKDWDLDVEDLKEILKGNFDNVRKAHDLIDEAETEQFLKDHDIQID